MQIKPQLRLWVEKLKRRRFIGDSETLKIKVR